MRGRRRRSRLAALVIVLILVELALQLAAPLVRVAMSRERDLADPTATLTVLCVGDSNTYGLHLPRVYAYPALLQAALGLRYEQPVNVINRGIPGQNSAQVAAGLEQDLAELSPDLVLILVGINDTWNTDGQDLGWSSFWGQLKLVRLTRVLLTGVTTASTFEVSTDDSGEIVVDRGEGTRRINQGDEPDAPGLAGDALADVLIPGLKKALSACRDEGSLPVLMTYAENQGPFAEVNELIRKLAADEQVLLIDHARVFEQHFASQGYDNLMFGDHHPNARGYKLMALGADSTLQAEQLVPARLRANADPGDTGPVMDRAPGLNLAAGGQIRATGPPGWAYQLLVACAPEVTEQGAPMGEGLPLLPDEVMALARMEPSFSGRFGDSGQVLLKIPPALAAAARCPLAACLLLLRDDPQSLLADDGQSIAAASEILLLP